MPETEFLTAAPDADSLPAKTPAISCNSADALRPVYPTVPPVEAELTRRIGRGRTFGLHALHEDAALSLQLSGNGPIDWSDVIALACPFGSIDLAQGSRLIRALTGIDLGAELDADTERWSWTQAAVVGRLASTPFASADRLSPTPLADTENAVSLRIVLQSREHAFATHARASASTWIALLADTASKRERLPESECLDLPIEMAVRIAHHALPASALRTLGMGDIILPMNASFTCNGEGYLPVGRRSMHVRFRSPSILEIIAMETRMETEDAMESMKHHAIENDTEVEASYYPDKTNEAGDEALNTVMVRMDFELGRLHMPLGDLRAVGAGTVMTITDGSPEAVTIRVSGKALGRGEIVNVGGKLGIRITAWGKSS